MTENEALKLGRTLYENITSNANNIIPTKKYIEFVGMANKALEEIQQYRAIGTVEEIKANKIIADERYDYLMDDIGLLKQYASIGTIEEFKALKEKSEPKKVEYFSETFQAYTCPFCETPINNGGMAKGVYCKWCGQKFDWSE